MPKVNKAKTRQSNAIVVTINGEVRKIHEYNHQEMANFLFEYYAKMHAAGGRNFKATVYSIFRIGKTEEKPLDLTRHCFESEVFPFSNSKTILEKIEYFLYHAKLNDVYEEESEKAILLEELFYEISDEF